jgi:hypothetical protein
MRQDVVSRLCNVVKNFDIGSRITAIPCAALLVQNKTHVRAKGTFSGKTLTEFDDHPLGPPTPMPSEEKSTARSTLGRMRES